MANIAQGDDKTHQELYILYKLSDSALSVLLYFTLAIKCQQNMQNTQYYISIIIANSFGYVLVTEDDIDVQKEIMHILKFYEKMHLKFINVPYVSKFQISMSNDIHFDMIF